MVRIEIEIDFELRDYLTILLVRAGSNGSE